MVSYLQFMGALGNFATVNNLMLKYAYKDAESEPNLSNMTLFLVIFTTISMCESTLCDMRIL